MSNSFPTRGQIPWDETLKAYIDAGDEDSGSGGPSGAAGGVLSGTYPDPGFATDMATQAELNAAVSDKQVTTQRNQNNGYAGLGSNGRIGATQAPLATSVPIATPDNVGGSNTVENALSDHEARFGSITDQFGNQQAAIDDRQLSAEKGAPDGYAALDSDGLVPSSQLPGLRRTISVVVPGVMGGEGLNVYPDSAGVFDAVNRGIVMVPEKTTRWRLRVANRSAVREGQTPGSGTFNFSGCWMGMPLVDQSRWQGLFASAPVKVIDSGSTSGETEWVTPWVTDPTHQLGPWPTALSLGMTAPTDTNRFYDDRSCSFIGTGASAAAGATGIPASATRYEFSSLDCRVEYEVTTDWPLVLALGDSITSGVSETPAIFQHESWPARAAVTGRFHVINGGVSNMLSNYFTTTTHWGWGRLNLGSQIPDAAVVLLGTNDLLLGSDEAAISSRLAALTTVLRNKSIPQWSFGTIIPGEFDEDAETARQAHNENVRNGWWGGAGMIDFDRAMRAEYGSASSTADLMDPANVHPKTAGYAAMALAYRG